MGQLICDISGSWKDYLIIGDSKYWSSSDTSLIKPMPIPNPLPSDPRYREDLIWLKRGNEEYA